MSDFSDVQSKIVKNEESTDAEKEARKAAIRAKIRYYTLHLLFVNVAYKCVLQRGPSVGRGKWSFE